MDSQLLKVRPLPYPIAQLATVPDEIANAYADLVYRFEPSIEWLEVERSWSVVEMWIYRLIEVCHE